MVLGTVDGYVISPKGELSTVILLSRHSISYRQTYMLIYQCIHLIRKTVCLIPLQECFQKLNMCILSHSHLSFMKYLSYTVIWKVLFMYYHNQSIILGNRSSSYSFIYKSTEVHRF